MRAPPRFDGLLTAFSPEKFSFVRSLTMTFQLDEGEPHPLLDKQNVALFTILRSVQTKKLILFINCHVLYNQNRGDIKILQLSLIRRAADLIKGAYNEPVEVIWGGDFNTVPCSPIYNFIRDGNFDSCYKYRKFEWSGQTSVFGMYKYSPFSKRKIMENKASQFNPRKSDRFFKREDKGGRDFIHLVATLTSIKLYEKDGEIKFDITPENGDQTEKLSEYIKSGEKLNFSMLSGQIFLKSAIADIKQKYEKPWMSGELLCSTIPDFGRAFTVDYIWYMFYLS